MTKPDEIDIVEKRVNTVIAQFIHAVRSCGRDWRGGRRFFTVDESNLMDAMDEAVELLRLRSLNDWCEDMEKAPRDGTEILLWWPFWSRAAIPGRWDAGSGDWHSLYVLSDGPGPLAWRPLPSPPSIEKKP